MSRAESTGGAPPPQHNAQTDRDRAYDLFPTQKMENPACIRERSGITGGCMVERVQTRRQKKTAAQELMGLCC